MNALQSAFGTTLYTICTALLIILAIICLGFGAVPFGSLRVLFDAMAPDGNAAGYSQAFHNQISSRLFSSGIVLSLIGLLFLVFRKIFCHFFIELIYDAKNFTNDFNRSFRRYFLAPPLIYPVAILGITVFGFVLRFHFLDGSLNHDESADFQSMWILPLHKGLTYGPAAWVHPITILLGHISYVLFGDINWAIRLPHFILGVLTIPLTYWFGCVLGSRLAGLIGAGFAAVAWPLVAYSVNARGYAAGTLAFVAMLGLVLYIIKSNNRFAWVILCFCAVVALFSVQSMVFAYGSAVVWLAGLAWFDKARKFDRKFWVNFVLFCLASFLLTLLVYSPFWLMNGFDVLIGGKKILEGTSNLSFGDLSSHIIMAIYQLWSRDILLILQLVTAVGLVAALVGSWQARILFIAAIAGTLPLFILVGEFSPPARLWNYLIPVMGVFVGLGLEYSIKILGKNAVALLVGWLFIPVLLVTTGYRTIFSNSVVTSMPGASLHAPPVSKILLRNLQEGDILLGDGITAPTRQYLNRALVKRGLKYDLEEMHPVLAGHAGRICQLAGCQSKQSNRSFLVTRNPIMKSMIYYHAIRETEPSKEKVKLVKKIMQVNIFAFEN
jgi:hypothetical protein